jgi:hypothetical protein
MPSNQVTQLAVVPWNSDASYPPGGQLSPDGRYVAFDVAGGHVDVLDVSTNKQTRLLTGDFSGCSTGYQHCFGYADPRWSPDGSLLVVGKGFYEGGYDVVIDPHATSPIEIALGGDSSWSSSSDAVCYGVGTFESSPAWGTALMLARRPAWIEQQIIAIDTDPLTSPFSVPLNCGWLSATKLVYATRTETFIPGTGWTGKDELFEIGTDGSGKKRLLLLNENEFRDMMPISQSTVLIRLAEASSQPRLLDVEQGTMKPILRSGDIPVAINHYW